MFNKAILIGRLGKNAQVKTPQNKNDYVGPYVLPNANLDFTFITAFGELLFTLWLWIRGWKVREPTAIS